MKYTDKYFKFPIRVYDGFSVQKAMLIEDKKLMENPEAAEKPEVPDWVLGYAKVPVEQILCWVDYFSEGRETSDVAQKGFDLTLIETRNLGKFECVWVRTKFEDELNKFCEKSGII